jgi:hypothetical protein
MKSVLSGITNIEEAAKRFGSGESRFLKIADGDSVTIRFLQELDTGDKNYDEKHGTAVGIFEHLNPEDFSQSFLCSREDEGRCLGCEKASVEKKWRPRGRLLINVLIRGNKGEESKVKILSTGIGNKGLTPTLVEFAKEYGTLCDRDYRLKRNGEGLKTSYTLLPREVSAVTKAELSLELIDFADVYKNLAYEEQVALVEDSPEAGW